MNLIGRRRCPVRWLLLAALGIMGLTLPGNLTAYDALYAFGDSLTDTGREPAEPVLHYNGRWSMARCGWSICPNGWASPTIPPTTTLSGAQCDDTFGQVNDLRPRTMSSNRSSSCGRAAMTSSRNTIHSGSTTGWTAQIAYSVGNLSNAVVTLYAKGARAVLVPNTVDVTEIPTINYLPSILRGYLRGKVLQFNIELALALDRIQTTLPQLRLYRVDFYAKVNGILSHASRYGFTETEIDALADVTLLDKKLRWSRQPLRVLGSDSSHDQGTWADRRLVSSRRRAYATPVQHHRT